MAITLTLTASLVIIVGISLEPVVPVAPCPFSPATSCLGNVFFRVFGSSARLVTVHFLLYLPYDDNCRPFLRSFSHHDARCDARGSLLRGGEGGSARRAGNRRRRRLGAVRFPNLLGRGGGHQRLVRGSGSFLQQTSRFFQAFAFGIVLALPTFLRLGLALALVSLLLLAFALLPSPARRRRGVRGGGRRGCSPHGFAHAGSDARPRQHARRASESDGRPTRWPARASRPGDARCNLTATVSRRVFSSRKTYPEVTTTASSFSRERVRGRRRLAIAGRPPPHGRAHATTGADRSMRAARAVPRAC